MWPQRPWCRVQGPSDVTVITWMHMQVMQQSLATFSNEDENEDEDWYDRLGPGTRTSSTAVFRRETKTFSKPVTVRGRVSSCSESHQGKCLSKNFVTSLYFSTAMKLFPMKSFCYFTIVSSQRIQIFPMKTINGLIWILWTPRSAKQSFVSRNTISLALLHRKIFLI